MRKLLIIFSLLIRLLFAQGQTPVGSWSDHLRYNTARAVAIGSEEVYATNGLSLLIYNKSLSDLRKLSRTNGLTETGISAIAWSEEKKMLIVAYLSGGIDLVRDGNIFYLPDIVRKSIPGLRIFKARANGNYCYLCCSFGIVVIDLEKKEIHDTWKPAPDAADNQVSDVAFNENNVFAATSHGIFSSGLNNQGLSYYGNWKLLDILPDPYGKYISIAASGSFIYACLSGEDGDKVYSVNGNSSTLFYSEPGFYVNSIDRSPAGLAISAGSSVRVYNNEGLLLKNINTYGWSTPAAMQAFTESNTIWIADAGSGLVKGLNMSEFTPLVLAGPGSNEVAYLASLNGKTVAVAGGISSSWESLMRPLNTSVFENNDWTNINSAVIKDPLRTLIDPADNDHFFVSSWGGGLLEYRSNLLVKQYNEKNSPLQTSVPGAGIKVCGMAMDKDRNLWITQSDAQGSLKVLKPDGTWITGFGTVNARVIGDLVIDKNGNKWVLLPSGYGLYVYDDNETPDVKSDDRSRLTPVRDEKKMTSNVYSIVSDLDGNIWVGTDQGPFIYYNPEDIFNDDYLAYRIRIPRNDGSNLVDYMLATETITSIAVDGANRKWIGTAGSGVYLLSADGTKQILNFNADNSPILSNTINSISVDNKTGDVWIGSSTGIQSYRGNATEGSDKFSGVYSFPNPVREDFEGNLTLTGLVRDSNIKITDISGNLVFETVSDGGSATWDLKNFRGQKVATGVYLAFCSSPDGKQAVVTKILVIH